MHLASAQRLLFPAFQAGISTVLRNPDQVCVMELEYFVPTQVRASGAEGLCDEDCVYSSPQAPKWTGSSMVDTTSLAGFNYQEKCIQ